MAWNWLRIIVGGIIGTFITLKIQMTDMPQLVAALHSFVGLAAVLVAIGTFLNHTNPAAELDKTSPIYGMQILQCSKTKQVFVIKRSMNTGYAGVDNLLYYMDNCSQVFGDAKEVVENLVLSIKES